MIKSSITISNKLGLHARASAKLTKLAGSFPCEVWMSRGDRRVNAKSIMGVMMLAAGIGSEVVVETNGERGIRVFAFGVDGDRAAFAGGQHHHAHDALGVDAAVVAAEVDVAGIATGQLGELG